MSIFPEGGNALAIVDASEGSVDAGENGAGAGTDVAARCALDLLADGLLDLGRGFSGQFSASLVLAFAAEEGQDASDERVLKELIKSIQQPAGSIREGDRV